MPSCLFIIKNCGAVSGRIDNSALLLVLKHAESQLKSCHNCAPVGSETLCQRLTAFIDFAHPFMLLLYSFFLESSRLIAILQFATIAMNFQTVSATKYVYFVYSRCFPLD